MSLSASCEFSTDFVVCRRFLRNLPEGLCTDSTAHCRAVESVLLRSRISQSDSLQSHLSGCRFAGEPALLLVQFKIIFHCMHNLFKIAVQQIDGNDLKQLLCRIRPRHLLQRS